MIDARPTEEGVVKASSGKAVDIPPVIRFPNTGKDVAVPIAMPNPPRDPADTRRKRAPEPPDMASAL